MFHPIVIRQETEAQCAGDEAPGQRGFHRPRPRPQVRVAPSPAHDLRQLPCVLLPSLGAAGGDCAGGGPGPAPRWPCPQRARSVPAAAWTPAHVAPLSLQTAAWGRAPPPKREVQTGRRRRWAAGPLGSSPAGEGDCADGGGGALRTAELQTRSRGPSPVWSRWGLRSICHSPRGADTISLLQTVSGAGDR